jgi:cytoskeletal protein CcmA (bactofilin family)
MKTIKYFVVLSILLHTISTFGQKVNGPISRACPLCPDFSCPTGPTGGTGNTGFTGFTGPCTQGSAAPFCCLDVVNNITVQGSLRAECVTVTNQFSVSGNADIKENLIVEELTDFVDDVCMERNLNVLGNVSVSGDVGAFGKLTVGDGAVINGFTGPGPTGLTGPALQVIGNEVVNGNLSVGLSETIGQNLTVGCAATVQGLLTASGALLVNNGSTIFNGGLTVVDGGAMINNNLCINGDETVSGNVTANELTVDGNATFNNFTIGPSGTLITNNGVVFNAGLTIAAGDEIIRSGNLTISEGDLSVAGTSTFVSRITTNGGATISGGLTVNGGQRNSVGDLDVSAGNAVFTGDLRVEGTINGGTGTLFSLTLTDTTNSLSPSSGTLVVTGGAGVAKDIWIGDSLYLPNITFGPAAPGVTGPMTIGVPTALNYYEETCFSTPFIWGGLTVNPPESVLIKAVRLGNLVNLLIPPIQYTNPGVHIDVVTSTRALPVRFRPFTTIRGASSTIIYNDITGLTPAEVLAGETNATGVLGEYDVSPGGIITFGLPGAALGPQRITSGNFVQVDANTITYNIDGCIASSSSCFTAAI